VFKDGEQLVFSPIHATPFIVTLCFIVGVFWNLLFSSKQPLTPALVYNLTAQAEVRKQGIVPHITHLIPFIYIL
jgi:hypothetical protein